MKSSALSMVINNFDNETTNSTEIPNDLNKVEFIGMDGEKAKFIIEGKEIEIDTSELNRTPTPEETGILYTTETGLLEIIPMSENDIRKLKWLINNANNIMSIYLDINELQKEIKKISEVINDMNFIERLIYRKKIKQFKEYVKNL